MRAPQSLSLESGPLRLELLSSGAAVRRLTLQREGGPADLVLGHADPVAYVTGGGFLGATIGRFANRIGAGRFTLDGVEHQLVTNQYGNTLHGGPGGFDTLDWTVIDSGAEHATFTLTSPDGDQGFPGAVQVTVTYMVAPGTVRIDYAAQADAPTVLNLTNHSYFHLDGPGSGPIDEHRLTVEADFFLPLRPDLVPTGERRAVEGSVFDLRTPRRLGDIVGSDALRGTAADDEQRRIAGGLDHPFVLREAATGGSRMRRAARLVGVSGTVLEVHTDQPSLQVYTGVHFDGSVVGLDGRRYERRAGIALETQGFPDAPNHPDFPSAVLRPGETFRSTTSWVVTQQ